MVSISLIGLGKLGLCTACCFASKGVCVYGYDKNANSVEKIKAGIAPIVEPQISEYMEKAQDNLTVVDDVLEAVKNSSMTMIIVPTPSGDDGMFINDYVIRVLEDIAPAIKAKSDFHIVNVVSTVMPGSSEQIFVPLLEKLTGKRCGKDFGLLYNPEFIAIGSVIKNFLNPDLILIGASDQRSADFCSKVYLQIVDNDPMVKTMSLLNAELTKLSINCYVTTKISFANALANLCEYLPGADVDVVADAVGSDSRVGSKYIKGGLGFGGPCFPRDNQAMIALGEHLGMGASDMLGNNVVHINNSVVERVCSAAVEGDLRKGAKISVFGLAYKQNTPLVECSQGIDILKKLHKNGYVLSGWDELAIEQAGEVLPDEIELTNDFYKCAGGSDVLIFAANVMPVIDWDKIRSIASGARIIDCWRRFKETPPDKFDYIPLGIGR